MASRWRHCVDLTGPGIEPHISRTNTVRLATVLTAGFQLNCSITFQILLPQQLVVNEWLCAGLISPPTFFFLQEGQNSMNRQCILHELVCWLAEKVLSARSQVGYNKKHNFELWCNVGICFSADRQKSRLGPVAVRGLAVESQSHTCRCAATNLR